MIAFAIPWNTNVIRENEEGNWTTTYNLSHRDKMYGILQWKNALISREMSKKQHWRLQLVHSNGLMFLLMKQGNNLSFHDANENETTIVPLFSNWNSVGSESANCTVQIEKSLYITYLSYNLPCIPKSLFLKSFLLTAISLDAKKSLFSSDSMLSCSIVPNSSIPWVILSNLPAGMTSAHRNLSSCRSAMVKLLDSSNNSDL